MKKIKGFTLAEVLITLTILGVVAAITVPNVLKTTQEREFLTRFKRVYSDLNRAVDMAVAENGPPETWHTKMCGYLQGCKPIEYVYSPIPIMIGKYLPQVQKCNSDVDRQTPDSCYLTQEDVENMYPKVTFLNGEEDTGWGKDFVYPSVTRYYLKNGAFVAIQGVSSDCSYNDGLCGEVFVDLNGKKKPNTYGKDLFQFSFTKKGIVPNAVNDCTKFKRGTTCAGWIIQKGNMNYLH